MRMSERVDRLTAKLAIIGQAADEAIMDISALEADPGGIEVANWLPGLKEALQRIQLDCVDARYATRALRNAVPATDALQPRLF